VVKIDHCYRARYVASTKGTDTFLKRHPVGKSGQLIVAPHPHDIITSFRGTSNKFREKLVFESNKGLRQADWQGLGD